MRPVDHLLAEAEQKFRRAYFDEARVLAEAALKLDPENVDALGLIAEVHRLAGRPEAAIGALRRALVFAPNEPYFHSALADLYRQSGRPEIALSSSGAAAQLMPGDADAHHAHGVTLSALGRDEEAIAAYRSALSLEPEHWLAHIELAMAYLRAGEYEAAWPHFEKRHHLHPFPDFGDCAPLWDGDPVDTLIVIDEGGHGDAVWAARFLPGLKSRVNTLVFAVRATLINLFADLEGVDRVVDRDDVLPDADALCPLLSVASHCNGLEAYEPARLAPDRDEARWHTLIAEGEGRLRVGIIWSGNVDYGNNHNRAAPLSAFLPLVEIPGVQLYSLQKGSPHEELAQANLGSLLIDADDFDFAETATLIGALDLIIMTDTAVAHIAGSLGKPTWVLLDHSPYWYFRGSGERTVWYPALRLFRQSRAGDWAGVIANVAEALADECVRRQTRTILSAY